MSEKKRNRVPNEQGTHKRNNGSGSKPTRTSFDKATDVVVDLGRIGSGVKAAYDIYKIVRPLINDPKWYDNGKVPGACGRLNSMLPNEWKRYHSATSLRFKSGNAPEAGNQIAILDVLLTRGGTTGKSDLVKAMYTQLERRARYTMPFSRDDLAQYIEDCKIAMILYAKGICWLQAANTFAAGNSSISYEQYVASTENGNSFATINSEFSSQRIAVEDAVSSLANFIEDNVIYNAPIMKKVFYASTTLFADSPKFGASTFKINYSTYSTTWDNYNIKMTSTTERRPNAWSAPILINWITNLKQNWPQIDSTIAGKLLETGMSARLNLKHDEVSKRTFPIVYDAEINCQLRNALMVNGFSYSSADDTFGFLQPESSFPQDKSLIDGSSFDPTDKLAPAMVLNPVVNAMTGVPVTAKYISLYRRLGRNHMQKFTSGVNAGEDNLRSIGIVETDDFLLEDSAHVASAIELVPRIGVSWTGGTFSTMVVGATGTEVPWRLSMARLDDAQIGLELVALSKIDTQTYYCDAGFAAMTASRGHASLNWGNSPIYDVVHFAPDVGQAPQFIDEDTDFNAMSSGSVIMSDTRYNRIFEVSDSVLAGIKYVQDYSLHSTDEFTSIQ